jgi:hypothetical protein
MFTLAAELKMTVAELGDRMSAQELQEWIEYQGIVGCLDSRQRADLGAGIVASTVANAHRSGRSQSFSPQDFMPYVDKPKQTPQQAIEKLKRERGIK